MFALVVGAADRRFVHVDAGAVHKVRVRRRGCSVTDVGDVGGKYSVEKDPAVPERVEPKGCPPLVGTSISSAGIPYELFAKLLPENPHVKFFESRKRGYILCEAGRKTMTADLRIVDDIRDPETKDGSLGRFVIEAGRPGALKA
jgi:alkaline phosphatase D